MIGRAILLTWADPDVHATFIYKTIDGTDDPAIAHKNLGLLHHDGRPKPSYAVYRELAHWIHQGAEITPLFKDEGKRLKDEVGSQKSEDGGRLVLSLPKSGNTVGPDPRSVLRASPSTSLRTGRPSEREATILDGAGSVLRASRPSESEMTILDGAIDRRDAGNTMDGQITGEMATTPGAEATRLRSSEVTTAGERTSLFVIAPDGKRITTNPAKRDFEHERGTPPTVSPPILYGYAITFPGRPFLDKWVLWTVFPEDQVDVTVRHTTGHITLRARPLGGTAHTGLPEKQTNNPAVAGHGDERGTRNAQPSSFNLQPLTFPISDHPIVLEATDFRGMDPDYWTITEIKVRSSHPRPITLPESATRHRPILGAENDLPL